MGQREKLIARLKARPSDFSFYEPETLLGYFGYKRSNKGKTSGSRIKYGSAYNEPILLHRPHGGRSLPLYEIKRIADELERKQLI